MNPLVLFGLFVLAASSQIILQPTVTSGPQVAIILLEGAQIPADRYIPLLKAVQENTKSFSVWAALPKIFLELPFEILAKSAIEEALSELQKQGFVINNNIYLAGHSLGGMGAADYAVHNPQNIAGLIQLASFLDRKHKDTKFNFPVLQIGGALDGLARVTRFAESFYERNKGVNVEQRVSTFPIVVLKGINHMAFAGGEPSWFVKQRDLKAEVSDEQAREMISITISAFLEKNVKLLAQISVETESLLQPLITAFEMEGSLHFNRPDQTTCSEGHCSVGSDWVIEAQKIISDKEASAKAGVKFEISNDYVILSSLPPFGKLYHPKLEKVSDKLVNITTFAQCSWDLLDKYMDGGFTSVSASEIGAKMISRQCSYVIGLGYPKAENPLDKTDKTANLCREVNKKALEYALSITSQETKERYEKFGQKLVFADDDVVNNGFSFTYTILKMNENSNGDMEVQSLTMMSDIDAPPIPIFAPDGESCFHYCKLLSPARAIEWIYVDSLRKNYYIQAVAKE